MNLGPPTFQGAMVTTAEFPPIKLRVGENSTFELPNVVEPDGDSYRITYRDMPSFVKNNLKGF